MNSVGTQRRCYEKSIDSKEHTGACFNEASSCGYLFPRVMIKMFNNQDGLNCKHARLAMMVAQPTLAVTPPCLLHSLVFRSS